MGFTDLIIKLSNTKFARKFQYEPYIIKSVEYINPNKEDCVLVIYKEADYLKSLMLQYIKQDNYVSFEVGEKANLDKYFDKIVLFFSLNELKKEHLSFISSKLKKNGKVYSIFYLNSSKFFEWTLRLTDKEVLKSMKEKSDMLNLEGFVLENELKLNKLYISISRYKREDNYAAEG